MPLHMSALLGRARAQRRIAGAVRKIHDSGCVGLIGQPPKARGVGSDLHAPHTDTDESGPVSELTARSDRMGSM